MNFKRLLSLIIALAMVVIVCVSCNGNENDPNKNQHKDEIIVATWNRGNIWSGDIKDWNKYFYARYYSDVTAGKMTTDNVLRLSINAYVLVPILEEYLSEKGYSLTEEELEISVLNYMAQLDATYPDEGGYNYWKDGIGVSDNFIYELTKYGIYNSKARELLIDDLDISDETLREYFTENSMDYTTPVGYVFNTALCEVLDVADEEEWDARFNDAKSFIEKAQSGTSFSDIQKQVIEKYTEEDGYILVPYYTTDGTLTKLDLDNMPKFDNLDTYLEELRVKYTEKGMDPSADKQSDEFKAYDEYLFNVYQGTVAYIFRNSILDIGEVYDLPIKGPNGWMIVEYDSYNNVPFAKFEDVKEDVREDYIASIQDELLNKFDEQLLEKYNVSYEDVEFVPTETKAS